mmetsp:Transcript_119314/g.210816  ORF Transcript_119314/g.210816 Transcript_119314/m.210816 type:complete len:410 (+) Transcript_119314:231-1460(+)
MGNEISAVAGGVATAATGVATGVTLGKVPALKHATAQCAKFTGKKFMDSNVRHVGELVGVSIAAAATLGQCEAVNECVRQSAPRTGKTLLRTLDSSADSLPIVGHIKGSIHYACGDEEGGHKAMRASNRTVGVMGGGAIGMLTGGPPGAVIGGIAGGAALDGTITVVESAVKHEYTPTGQVAAWTKALENKDPQSLIEGLVEIAVTPIGDGLAGYAAGKMTMKIKEKLTGNPQRVYRVVPEEAVDKMVEDQSLTRAPQSKGQMGETCVTESATKHSRQFLPQRQKQTPAKMSCAEFKVEKRIWDRMKDDSIPQQGSRPINEVRIERGLDPLNVTTTEKLGSSGEISMNIKGNNVATFNKGVVKVAKVNVLSCKYKSDLIHATHRIGKPAAGAAIAAAAAAEHTRSAKQD